MKINCKIIIFYGIKIHVYNKKNYNNLTKHKQPFYNYMHIGKEKYLLIRSENKCTKNLFLKNQQMSHWLRE